MSHWAKRSRLQWAKALLSRVESLHKELTKLARELQALRVGAACPELAEGPLCRDSSGPLACSLKS